MRVDLFQLTAVLASLDAVGAKLIRRREFNGHTYELYNDKMTGYQAFAFAASQTHCGQQGYLATITSEDEKNFIWYILHGKRARERFHPWIGLTDKDHEGQFYWANGETLDYQAWSPGEPRGSKKNDCVAMGVNELPEWYDRKCKKRSRALVIEYSITCIEGATGAESTGDSSKICTGPTGKWSGDPHVTTFDGLKYDCQGRGEFLAVKSLDSPDFFIQSRFMIGAGHGLQGQNDYPVTVTRSVVFNTGETGVPDIQVDVPDDVDGGCPYTFFVNHAEAPNILTQGTGTNKVIVSQGDGRSLIFRYPETETRIEVTVKLSKKNGCSMTVQVCLSSTHFGGENIIGLLGSPDNNQDNDWMSSTDGTPITTPIPSSRFGRMFKPAYDYCTAEWCIDNAADSKFEYPDPNRQFDYYNYCNNVYDYDDTAMENALENASQELVQICGNENYECLLEGVVGGQEDAVADVEVNIEMTTIRLAAPPAEPAVDGQGNVQTDDQGNPVTEAGIAIVVTPIESPLTSNEASLFGDPHIKTWMGERYDFHGICDLVMLHNPDFGGVGMDIHIRSKKVQRWSYIASAVLRIGSETLEVMGRVNKYWINGMEGGDLTKGLSGFTITHRVVNQQQQEFRVGLDESANEAVVFRTFKDMVRVDVEDATSKNFGRSLGLLGTFAGGLKIARDRETVIQDDNAFGQEWQVLASEDMLFHVAEGPQAPEKCSIPSTETIRRRLEESSITLQDAEMACSRVSADDFDSCVFDVLATNDRDVAGSY